MIVNKTHLNELKKLVEKSAMHPLKTSKDFELLHWQMQERQNSTVGITTLKRLWAYVEGYEETRESTLDVLCRFVGFPDWHTFVADYCEVEGAGTSRRILTSSLPSETLPVGKLVVIEWNPKRRLWLKHKGEGYFEVVESTNAKLAIGDTFHCTRFLLNQPLYVDNCRRGDEPPCMFAMGLQGGLTRVEVLDE